MTVQEIFNSTAVQSVEEQILDLYHETERKHWCNDENKKAIKSGSSDKCVGNLQINGK